MDEENLNSSSETSFQSQDEDTQSNSYNENIPEKNLKLGEDEGAMNDDEDDDWIEEDEFLDDEDDWNDDDNWNKDAIAEPTTGQGDRSSDDEDEKDTEDVNFNDMMLDDEARKAVKSKRGIRHGNEYSDRLTEGFKLLMGEANLCVAKGDRKTATNICLEIIRNIPDSPAPYETLSVIFEEENDLYKSLQYGLVSAHLWPKDPHKWYGLAEKCKELNDKENEKICMGKALRYSHLTEERGFIDDILSYFLKPGEEDLSEDVAIKLALGYRKLIKISKDGEQDELIALLESFENKCSGNSRKEDFWAKTYQYFIRIYPESGSQEKIRKICKLYLSGKNYGRIVPLLSDAKHIQGDVVTTMPNTVISTPTIVTTESASSMDTENSTQPMMEVTLSDIPPVIDSVSTPNDAPPVVDLMGDATLSNMAGLPNVQTLLSENTLPNVGNLSIEDPSLNKDIQDKVQEKLSEMTGGTTESVAAAATPSFDTRYSIISELCSPFMRAALVTALIYCDHDAYNIESLLRPLIKDLPPDEVCEELTIIADAYYETSNISAAHPIYDVLSKTPTHSVHAHTLVQLGLCLEHTGAWKDAVKCYERVLGFDAANTAAKLRLFTLQQTFIAENESEFNVNIHADLDSVKELRTRPDVVKLSFHRCYELISAGCYSSVMEEGYTVLKTALFESIEQQKSKSLKSNEFLRGNNTSAPAFHTLAHIVKDRIGHHKGACEAYRTMLTREEWYDWYIGILSCCLASDRLKDGFILSLAALASRLIDLQPAMKNILIHSIYLAGVLNYSEFISENIGPILYSNPDSPGIWNIFYSIRHRLPQYRLHRLGIRWLHKNKGAFNGLFLNMQNSFYSRHYKAAIAFFRQMLGQRPRDAKIYFYLSLFYMHYAANKALEFASRRHEMTVQAIACILMYHQLRGSCQETLYNIGRCYHHLGLFTFAMQYYKRALASPPTIPEEVESHMNRMRRSAVKREEKEVAAKREEKDGGSTAKPAGKDGGSTAKPAGKDGGSAIKCTEKEGGGAAKRDEKEGSGVACPESADTKILLHDVDLRGEIVHNMSLIYLACGADHLARQLMYTHSAIT